MDHSMECVAAFSEVTPRLDLKFGMQLEMKLVMAVSCFWDQSFATEKPHLHRVILGKGGATCDSTTAPAFQRPERRAPRQPLLERPRGQSSPSREWSPADRRLCRDQRA